MRYLICVVAVFLTLFTSARAQSPNATLNGQVVDSSGGGIAGANVDAVNVATNIKYSTKTNGEGMYLLPELPPANYEIQVSHTGFKTIVKPDVLLNVRDAVVINFTLPVGAVSERVTVEGGAPLINTQDAAVSTVVDRQFAENLPMNGRSFQTLIELTPGVVLTSNIASSLGTDGGEFSVDGQRASSNYWMVDGVSANIGVSPTLTPGSGFGGGVGSFSVLGGTNSLVSVDAMQEFRIQTSTYAPEFGRTPGGQISIVTRSGTNQFHGTAFDYLRNDVLDANNWFANSKGLRKPRERQNDFGGTFSGPILKERTFFFFSYEGLRLRLPQTTLTTVPCDSTCQVFGNARTSAVSAMQPYLNAFPLANGPEVFRSCTPNVNGCPASGQQATGAAEFNASYSNAATLDAYSLRIDHKLNEKLLFFGRYNYSPSDLVQRGFASSLNTISPTHNTTQTATIAATWLFSPRVTNDLRFNYSKTSAESSTYLDSFGGAVPLAPLPLPAPFTRQNGLFSLIILSLTQGTLGEGAGARNVQRQINVIDNVALQTGLHNMKFGIDFRRLAPIYDPRSYIQLGEFLGVSRAETGNLFISVVGSNVNSTVAFHNLGIFAQDTWRVIPRLTLTYGLRWDVDFAPSFISGPSLPGVTGFDVTNLSRLTLGPTGTPPFQTTYDNIAPRVGIAYQLSDKGNWQTVVRGGFGVFFDLKTSEVGNAFLGSYPFQANAVRFGGAFPLSPAAAAPPAIKSSGQITAFDPDLQLPYTLQWNVSFEQGLGAPQTFSASYVGSAGRRLIQSATVHAPNANFATAVLIGNSARSDYDALQLQFQRRLSHRLQALASYTWSHSIDDGSAGSYGNPSNTVGPATNPAANRGPSDFDIRSAFSAGLTYEIPASNNNTFARAILRGWSLENIVQARSAPPVDVSDGAFLGLFSRSFVTVRPDLVPGIPLYLYSSRYPGGKVLNNTPNQGGPGCEGPFCPPPTDASGFFPLRQGNLSRNALRGFGAAQWDFAVHRDFPIRESLKLQFRAEMFNVLNHPNFGQPIGDINKPTFGQSTQMLGQSFGGGNLAAGGLNPLYQVGGPRSIQFALKLSL